MRRWWRRSTCSGFTRRPLNGRLSWRRRRPLRDGTSACPTTAVSGLRRVDHHGHPHGKVPLDVAVEKPESGVVLLPLDDRVAARVDAVATLLARLGQVQGAAVVIARTARALVEDVEVTAMDVEGMGHPGRVVQ